MPSNKDRLSVVIYTRQGNPTMPGKEDTYHWALLVAPKNEPSTPTGTLLHTTPTTHPSGLTSWSFEESTWPLSSTATIVARITVGKVVNKRRLLESLRATPVRHDDPRWNDVYWVKEALGRLRIDPKGLGTSVTEWGKVRNGVMNYCQVQREQQVLFEKEVGMARGMKKKVMLVGNGGRGGIRRVPTFDLMERKEVEA
ncbi:hypothetical protein BJY04DRAFT_198989 [Aspergillus karnatakaensis]|uniref:uncharacterized protein n=1 Tax=Aspergillus karnatakaensis TaxID=1810916 RepID=UPI003CCCE9CE